MKNLWKVVVNVSIIAMMPVFAHAAGTYYTGGTYQSPQQRYTAPGYSAAAYNTSGNYAPAQRGVYNTNAGYGAQRNATNGQSVNGRQNTRNNTASRASGKSQSKSSSGFFLNAGMAYEFGQWQYEMKTAGSILHYDNIAWGVFDVNGGYKFNWGKTALMVDAGLKYGVQMGDAHMVDDDITNGGVPTFTWTTTDGKLIGTQYLHSMSTGTSNGGDMLGFNVGFGLPDFFKLGNARITPSVGFRYFKYKLETKKNYGLSVETAACYKIADSDEIQCDPAIIVNYGDNNQQIIWPSEPPIDGKYEIGNGATSIEMGNTYYYELPGTSHSYETTWAGPYVAVDVDYDINANNAVNARFELGMPGYKSTGDQPYRTDWQHPKSVEDDTGMFGAIHFGMGANWTTALTQSVALSVGLTFDYYNVSGADSKTYYSPTYWEARYSAILAEYEAKGLTEADMLGQNTAVAGNSTAIWIKELETKGWVESIGDEIKSFYKSMGIRVGINAKF